MFCISPRQNNSESVWQQNLYDKKVGTATKQTYGNKNESVRKSLIYFSKNMVPSQKHYTVCNRLWQYPHDIRLAKLLNKDALCIMNTCRYWRGIKIHTDRNSH